MRKLLLKAVVSILSLWISGCESLPFLKNRDSSTTNIPKDSPTPKVEAPESPSPKPTNGVFPSSDISQKPKTAIDLIRSTNPNERIKSLEQGIPTNTTSQAQTSIPTIPNTKDPFSGLPTIPVPSTITNGDEPIFTQLPEVSSQQVPDVPNLPETFGGLGEPRPEPSPEWDRERDVPKTDNKSPSPKIPNPMEETPIPPTPTIQPSVLREPDASKPLDLPSSSTQQVPSLPELPIQPTPPTQWSGPGFPPPPPPQPLPPPPPPPPPDTTIANGIEVSGVVQVGSQKQIIVKVPTELTSRYVKIGENLANGKVLVKRVNLNKGALPIVVFEQSGVEIAKEVGSKPKTTED
ncbi:MAG: hypothetical protein MGF17_04990 [Trichodesmium sp. MAG_R04]|nr:hypothetical protein [Trichodesmium sp. MAG_R04]